MKLWIVRHAVAMDRQDYRMQFGPQAADELRPLTEAGSRKMRKQARGLRELIARPDALISSPLTRALQTTEILQSVWPGSRPQFCESLSPDSPPGPFVKWINAHLNFSDAENCDVVIVGHNPGLPILIQYLMTGDEVREADAAVDLKKGGVCCLEFDGKIGKGEGHLVGLLPPKILRSLVGVK